MELARRICQSLTETHVQECYSTVIHSLYSLHMGNFFFWLQSHKLIRGGTALRADELFNVP